MPVLLFCIAFGLSMDYEVFLLSRIRELSEPPSSRLSSELSSRANSATARQSPPPACFLYPFVLQLSDLNLLDESDPFEIDAQAAHLFKHPRLGIEDIREVWASDPMFYPAKPPAHWLMVAEVDGTVLMVPLAPARDGNPRRCRPIGCYAASKHLADQYRGDR
jgi:hypothetical protein